VTTTPRVIPATRGCAAIECSVPVRGDELMCRRHWFMVPAALRDFLTFRYQPGRLVGRCADGTLMAPALEAVRAVAGREGKAVPR
jgi:hypothetical protein